jgi:hypothetical protein
MDDGLVPAEAQLAFNAMQLAAVAAAAGRQAACATMGTNVTVTGTDK